MSHSILLSHILSFIFDFYFFNFLSLFATYHGALLQYFPLELQESFLNLNLIEKKGKEVSEGLLSSKSIQKNINPSSG
jgi:hypothetical protein